MLSRREFIAGAAAAAGLHAAPLGLPIGCQTYPVKDALGKDFDGTLRELASAGFKSIEICSPHGYSKTGYGTLLNRKPAEIRKKIRAAGLVCESCHYQFNEFQEPVDERIAYAKEIGLKQMVLATFSLRNGSIAQWTKAAESVNRAAEKIRAAGLRAAFHNHNVEFTQADGVLIWDRLMEVLDPKLIQLQFQVWVVSMGVDPVAQIEKYAARISSLHLQDYSPETKGMAALGKGSIDWPRLFRAAKQGAVRNYFVEMDLPLMRESVPFLRALKA